MLPLGLSPLTLAVLYLRLTLAVIELSLKIAVLTIPLAIKVPTLLPVQTTIASNSNSRLATPIVISRNLKNGHCHGFQVVAARAPVRSVGETEDARQCHGLVVGLFLFLSPTFRLRKYVVQSVITYLIKTDSEARAFALVVCKAGAALLQV